MLKNNLVCLSCPSFNLLSWELCGSKPNIWALDFIKILTQIKNKISKVWHLKKKCLNEKVITIMFNNN